MVYPLKQVNDVWNCLRLCGVAVKISKRRQMKLFKTCVQSRGCFLGFFYHWSMLCAKNLFSRQVYSSLISIVGLMLYYKKYVFKAIRKLLFSLLSYFFNTKNYYVSIVRLMCVQASGKLLFSLLSYFCNMKICSQNKREAAFVIRKMFIQNKQKAAL